MLGDIRLRWGARGHLLLVCLVCSECVVLAVLLLLVWLLLVLRLLMVAIVSSMALRVAGIVLAVGLPLHAVLEAACLGWAVRVLSSRRTKLLRAVATLLLLLAIDGLLRVCIGVVIRVLVSTLLLWVLVIRLAVAALVPVVRHDGQVVSDRYAW